MKRLQTLPAATVASDSVVSDDEPEQSVQHVIEDDESGYEWRDVPNAELKGDRRHDAYHEKLRRSVEAIQEYNAGLDTSEQFSITGSLLRQLTGVKPGLVKLWMTEHKLS